MNVRRGAQRDARTQRIRSRVCSSAKSVALRACACPRGLMGTSKFALAIIIGRPREEAPNALDLLCTSAYLSYFSSLVMFFFIQISLFSFMYLFLC